MVGTDALLRKVTRSHKYNERPHGPHSASYQPPAPRYFAKSGHVDADPRKVKKNGGGRMNWYATLSRFGRFPIMQHVTDCLLHSGVVLVMKLKISPSLSPSNDAIPTAMDQVLPTLRPTLIVRTKTSLSTNLFMGLCRKSPNTRSPRSIPTTVSNPRHAAL